MTNSPRTVLAVLVGAHVVNDFYSTVLPAFLPSIASEFSLDYTELGVLSFAFVLATGILQPILGNYADRKGRRRAVLTFGFAVAAAGFLVMAVSPSFWMVVAVSFFCGFGSATYHPQATAFLVDAFPNKRGRAMGIHGWGGSIGHFLAPAVVVFGVAWFGWRTSMALVALPLLVAAAVVRSRITETPASPSSSIKGILSRPLIHAAFAFGVVSIAGGSFITFFIKMLVDEGWQETRAGLLLSGVLLSGAIAQTLGGWGFDRYGGKPVVSVASVVSLALIVGASTTKGAISLAMMIGVIFALFGLFPVTLAQASKMAPKSQTGAAAGLFFGVSGLTASAARPAVGAIAEASGGFRTALVWLIPVATLGVALALTTPDPRPQNDSRPSPADRP